jgi:hypothetical protein
LDSVECVFPLFRPEREDPDEKTEDARAHLVEARSPGPSGPTTDDRRSTTDG